MEAALQRSLPPSRPFNSRQEYKGGASDWEPERESHATHQLRQAYEMPPHQGSMRSASSPQRLAGGQQASHWDAHQAAQPAPAHLDWRADTVQPHHHQLDQLEIPHGYYMTPSAHLQPGFGASQWQSPPTMQPAMLRNQPEHQFEYHLQPGSPQRPSFGDQRVVQTRNLHNQHGPSQPLASRPRAMQSAALADEEEAMAAVASRKSKYRRLRA